MFKILVAATYGTSCIKYTKILRESTVFKVQEFVTKEKREGVGRNDTHTLMQYEIILQVPDITFKVSLKNKDIFLNNILRYPVSQVNLSPKSHPL